MSLSLKVYSVDQVAEILGIHRETARSEIASGAIEAFSVGKGTKRRVWRVSHESLERYIKTKTNASSVSRHREKVQTAASTPKQWV
ncbi:MAG: helix-turn-helix domain-containing protein [Phycisphaera sp. RhM]|nr:helix-turn-helix domain-containing protein [Phycisphaera sp. RhM]